MNQRLLLVVTTATALTLAFAAPASADETTATVTVTGGTLEINAPTSAGSLGSRANTVLGVVISGPMGEVQVTDARSAAAGSGWVASAISTAFTPTAGPAIPASAIGYSAGAIAKVGTATFTAGDEELTVTGGNIVIVPPETPHGFKGAGDDLLRVVSVHPSSRVQQTDL